MSIPYLPGLWDEINRGGAVEKFVGGLDRRMRPEAYAQQNLNNMIQQNPAVLEQIANMDPTQRDVMMRTMGLPQGALNNIAPGAERVKREEVQTAKASLTPDQRTQLNASIAGVAPQEDIDFLRRSRGRKEQAEGLELDTAKINLELNQGKLKDFKKTQAQVDEALAKFGPVEGMDVGGLVRDFIRNGQPIDPLKALVIQTHPGAAALFELSANLEMRNLLQEGQQRLASMRDPNELSNLLKIATEVGNQLNDTERIMSAERKSWDENYINQARKTPYPRQGEYEAVVKERTTNTKRTIAILERLAEATGVELPKVEEADDVGPTVNREEELMRKAGLIP